ncbi:VOC family protein [Pseudonocardia xishanensis]
MGFRSTETVIEIVTADLGEALAFYRALGLGVPEGVDEAPHVEVPLPGGNRLAFDPESTVASVTEGYTPPTGEGRVALAFGFDTPAEVDEAHGALVGAGAPSVHAPFDAPWGQRYATVTDPDGTHIDLFAALP